MTVHTLFYLFMIFAYTVFFIRLRWVSKTRLKISERLGEEWKDKIRKSMELAMQGIPTPHSEMTWPPMSEVCRSFDYMFWHFWIWDEKKFMTPEEIIKRI